MPQQPSNPPSGWTPVDESVAQAGPPSGWTPVNEEQPGFLDKEIPLDSYTHATESGLQSIGRGVRGAISGAWNTVKTAANAWNDPKADVGDTVLPDPHLEQVSGAVKDINASPDPLGTYAKVGQETAGQGAGAALTALAGEAAGPVAGKIPAGRIAQTIGKVAKGVAEDIPIVRQGGKIAKYWNETAPKSTFPGAPEPATPPTEVTQASSLYRGASSPPDPTAGLGQIPVKSGQIRAKFDQQSAPTSSFSRPNIQNLLNESLDAAPPLDPRAPIYQRGQITQQFPKAAVAPSEDLTPVLQKSLDQVNASKSADVPEGHTLHDSSALRSSKYDSAANEFHARMTSGDTTYVYGDVAPEEAQAFAGADSKGKAYQQIKSSHPLVAKIVNGKRIAVKRPQ